MSSPGTSAFRNSRAFRAAIADPALGRILEIYDFDPGPAIRNVDRPVAVVSCYSDRSRQLSIVFDSFVLLVQNSYMLGFVHGLGGAWLYHCHRGPLDLDAFRTGFSKKLVGEQLYRRGPSEIARVLFLESVLAFERDWRIPVEARAVDEALRASSDALTRMTSHFMLHHELGHIATMDPRFHPFIRERVDLYLAHHDTSDVPAAARRALREEAEADLFGLSSCIAAFAPVVTEGRMREYLTFTARALTALNVLYAMADDLHRENVDSAFPSDIDESFALWRHREYLMTAYIESFPFDSTTVECAATDELLPIPDASILFEGLTDSDSLVGPIDEDDRRFVRLVNFGFAEGGSFEDIVQGTRVQWVLERS
ncbi:MAG: hypothetical protein ACXW27_00180 [Allosphingosinicella sp.]